MIENIHTIDSFVQIIYAYRDGPDYVARMVRCDKRINVTDTLELMRGHFCFLPEKCAR